MLYTRIMPALSKLDEIKSIQFGILSSKDILNMSVLEITSAKKTGDFSVYDPRMGSIDNVKCSTCNQDAIGCPGHFGHITMSEPIIHPLYLKKVLFILRCVCMDCGTLLLPKDHIKLKMTSATRTPKQQGVALKKIMSKVHMCSTCFTPQATYKANTADNLITSTYQDAEKQKVTINLTARQILKTFQKFSDDDIRTLGLNPTNTNPCSMIIMHLPILPPCCRPFVRAAGNLCDDDLSNQYIEIIKINNKLKKLDADGGSFGPKRVKLIQSLKFRIATTFNNSAGRAKHTTNGRPVKCIKSRISGKDGQMRGNIMGRRANQTARTVIGPDTFLKNGEMSIPIEISRILTIPEYVNDLSRKKLERIVNSGNARFVNRKRNGLDVRINLDHARVDKGTRLELGDEVLSLHGDQCTIGDNSAMSHDRISSGLKKGDVVKRNDAMIKDVKYRKFCTVELQNGDIVERCLRNGDTVVLNRQPTLHKASMMAFQIFVRPGKTFRFNLACTKTFNADFDGDEMNIHTAQSIEARAEIENLSTVKSNLITGQTSKMNIVLVQDAILGAYLMTVIKSRKITKAQFMNAVMRTSVLDKYAERVKQIEATLARVRKECPGKTKTTLFSGRGLVSFILPSNFCYKKKNGKEEDEPWVEIEDGVILTGCLSKTSIGSSIPHYIHNEYSAERCLNFLDDMQFITNAFLEITSFSVGFRDCFSRSETSGTAVKDTISRCFMEANSIESSVRNPTVKESRVNASLGKAKDIGLRIAKDNLSPSNSFISTVTGGSKGDFFNIAQITGLLGQQNISGKRLPLFLNGERSIPHYPKNDKEYTSCEKYESRGFISSSFISGLNPREFFFHACSGREGMSDTAVGTAVSGYIQRRIVKLQEDLRVQYDGTVRDETGRIFQLRYGDYGMNPEKTIKTKNGMWFSDIERIATLMNAEV